ncbi:MAG: DUF4906 domain-containing protein [Bacteroidales bacterium]|nr:DUF4906 domain-containing protein [Bacteroidales bacterium]
MKSRLSILLSIALLAGCTIDYKDEINPAKDDASATGHLTVNVCVSGTFASDDTAAQESEYTVNGYDLLVFDDATGQLQYLESDITPSKKEAIAGTSDYLLDVKEIDLPNTGQKRVIVIANAGSSLEMPELVTSSDEEGSGTLLKELREGVAQILTEAPALPLVMVGETRTATSNGTTVPVTLSRTVAKIKVVNKEPESLKINSISVAGASASALPLAESAELKTTETIDFDVDVNAGTDCAVFYILPTEAEKMTVTAEGTLNGTAFTAETLIQTDVYADYGCRLEYGIAAAKVKSSFYPEFDVEKVPPITVSGDWLSGTTEITLPFIAETIYGFTFDVTLEEGSPAATVSKNEDADWYDVEISDNKVRVRALKENAETERKSSFNIASGGNVLKIDVKQQGVKDISTVTFAGIEWMDRNLGATARANMAGSSDIKSYGYLYQWGRNIPFPVEGAVETVSGQMTPQEAMQTNKFIVYAEGTQDWNSQGIEGTYLDKWDSVNPDPCPEGFRLPTYPELETILPYRVVALMYAKGRQNKSIAKADGSKYQYVGFGIGNITEYRSVGGEIRGIMNQGTDNAYHLKWLYNNEGGTMLSDANNGNLNYIAGGKNVLRISYIDGDSSSDYPKIADADEFWSTHTPEQDIYFPCPGRRDATGAITESGTSAFYWSGSMYKGNKTTESYASGLLYFRPAGKFMVMTAPAIGTADVYTATEAYGYRNQAFSIRCVKK